MAQRTLNKFNKNKFSAATRHTILERLFFPLIGEELKLTVNEKVPTRKYKIDISRDITLSWYIMGILTMVHGPQ